MSRPAAHGARLYAALARLAPAGFRRAHGEEAARAAADLEARELAARGWPAALRLRLHLAADLLRTVTALRWEAALGRAPRQRRRHRTTSRPRRSNVFHGLAHDLRDAARTLRRAPLYSLLVASTMALGIGATAAVFSVVHAVLLRPLPYAEPERLVLLAERNSERGWDRAQMAPANLLDWGAQSSTLAASAGFSDWSTRQTLLLGQDAVAVTSKFAAGDPFAVLGVPLALGRSFRDQELWRPASDVVVLSHEAWQRLFAGDPGVVGRSITLDARSREVIGVLPPGFQLDGEADLWQPFGWEPESRAQPWFRRAHFVRGVGRLAAGATAAAAESELGALAARLEAAHPDTNRGMGARVVPLGTYLVGSSTRPLTLLFAAVLLVLLVASINVAHLQLARSVARAREDALRDCLGASAWRQIRRKLGESLLLAAIGATAGTAVAWLATPALVRLAGPALPGFAHAPSRGAVVAFAAVITAVAALVAAAPPLWRTRRSRLDGILREARGGAGRERARRRSFLVAAEVALAVTLVAGAFLLVRTFARMTELDPGFDDTGVMVGSVSLPRAAYPEATDVSAAATRLVERLAALPGVEVAAAASSLPLDDMGWSSDFSIEGRDREAFGIEVRHREVTPGYFPARRVPVLAGRAFAASDDAAAPAVVVINEALARRHFPGQDPLGQRLCFDRYPGPDSVWRTIVGVVGDERTALAEPAGPQILAPLAQDPGRTLELVVRSPLPPARVAEAMRGVVRAFDRQMPVVNLRPAIEIRREAVRRERFLLTLFSAFGAIALVLSSLGVYGVAAQASVERRREIGVRLALGAEPGRVLSDLLRRGMLPVLGGLAAGAGGALLLGQAMRGILFGVGAADAWSLAAAPALLLLTAGLAMAIPFWRATGAPPAGVLRAD